MLALVAAFPLPFGHRRWLHGRPVPTRTIALRVADTENGQLTPSKHGTGNLSPRSWLTRHMTTRSRLALLVAAFGLLAGACTEAEGPKAVGSAQASAPNLGSGAPGAAPIVPCSDAIDVLVAPPEDFEVVFDAVALPTRTVLQANESGEPGWLFAKQGLVVRSDAVADLVIPAGATDHVKIGWGSPGPRGSKLRLAGCTGWSGWWLAFAGGYWVDAPACVPLVVRSGARESQVRIPVGIACT